MVFRTVVSFMRHMSKPTPGPDRYWRRQKFLKFSAHFFGRKQNCYRIAMRYIIRALTNTCKSRKLKPLEKKELMNTRLAAACEEHGFTFPHMRESLIRSNILLDRKILTDLAIWEPRTFKCIVDFAWNKAKSENLPGIDKLGEPPSGVVLKPTPVK